MEELKAWSFLVSSSQNLEFTTIVAPDFICDAQIPDLLKKAVAKYRYPIDSGQAVYIEIPYRELGNIVLVFRTSWASTKYIGREEDEILKDPQRPIPFIEGMVLKESIRDDVVAAINFEQIHEQLVKHYKDFWELTTLMPATPSKSFNLLKDIEPNRNLILKRETPLTIASKPQSGTRSRSESWQCLGTLSPDSGRQLQICSIAFSPDGNMIVLRYSNQVIKIWNWSQQRVEFVLDSYKSNSASSVAFSPDGQIVASGMLNEQGQSIIKLWNYQKDKETNLTASDGHTLEIYAVAFEPSGDWLVSGSKDKSLKLWNLPDKKHKCDFKETGFFNSTYSPNLDPIKAIAISPNGMILASGDEKGCIKFWDMAYAKNKGKISTFSSVNSVAFSPDSQLLASGNSGGNIQLWEVASQKEIRKEKVDSPINSIALSSDNRILASGSDDKHIRIWDVETFQNITTLSEHTKEVTSVSFSPNGQLLASGSKDGIAKVWCRT